MKISEFVVFNYIRIEILSNKKLGKWREINGLFINYFLFFFS